MSRPLMMVSLPNCGSNWLAETIARHLPGCRYYREFFNPILNLKHEAVLRRNFGSELVSCYRNIASRGDEHIDDDIRATWGSEDYNFTKENQSAFKLPVFVRHFRCFVLLREEESVFPPSRARVWSFYEHAWHSLELQGYTLSAESTVDRAKEAHRRLVQRLVNDAHVCGVPIIWHHELMAGAVDTIRYLMAMALGVDLPALAAEIVATRREKRIAA